MKIGFVVNDVRTEEAVYTTTRLARTALECGHECWVMGVADLSYDPDGSIHARARRAPSSHYQTGEQYLAQLQGPKAIEQRVTIDQFDILWLRNDPASDVTERPWAVSSGILFGELAAKRGVIVLNDPSSLAKAVNKTYFEHFPELVRPRTCISRNVEEIRQFIAEQNGRAVIKPVQGSGGHNVFLIDPHDEANVNQMIEAVLRDGYCVAQEYLPAAAEGDVRLFVMNGRPLQKDGQYAAFRRVNAKGDVRSNMHVGGRSEPAEIGEHALQLVDIVRPKLVRDGMFLVGLDIVDHKLMEINVFSPGGLGSAERHTQVDFTYPIIEALERKVGYRRYYGGSMSNAELATL